MLRPQVTDLFGEIPVSLDDVEIWLDHLPRLRDATDARRKYYARAWNVVDKIKWAKQNDQWPPVWDDFHHPRLVIRI